MLLVMVREGHSMISQEVGCQGPLLRFLAPSLIFIIERDSLKQSRSIMKLLSSVIQVCRRSIAYLMCLLMRFSFPFGRLAGYKRSCVGACTILAPPEKMPIILEGIALLQTLDPAMLRRLTGERPYFFWYNDKATFLQAGELFAITDSFLYWGKEGIAIFFVQCMLEFDLMFLPRLRNLQWRPEDTSAARSEIQRQVLEWIRQHSFQPELVRQYEEFAKQRPSNVPANSRREAGYDNK